MTDWDGKGYEQISDLQRHLAQRTLAGLQFRGDERVLDVGCGDGFITRSIAARLPTGSLNRKARYGREDFNTLSRLAARGAGT